jgi:hypothetical protein
MALLLLPAFALQRRTGRCFHHVFLLFCFLRRLSAVVLLWSLLLKARVKESKEKQHRCDESTPLGVDSRLHGGHNHAVTADVFDSSSDNRTIDAFFK